MHRYISSLALDLIKKFEGFRNSPYKCPSGINTIAYGHVIKKDEIFTIISEEEGDDILMRDLFTVEKSVLRLINVPLTNGQFDALVSFTYNVGSGALQRSCLRQKINREEYEDAEKEFLKFVYSNGKKLHGLAVRRMAEVSMYSS